MAKVGQVWTSFGPSRSNIGPTLAQIWPNCGPRLAMLAEVGPMPASLGKSVRQLWGNILATPELAGIAVGNLSGRVPSNVLCNFRGSESLCQTRPLRGRRQTIDRHGPRPAVRPIAPPPHPTADRAAAPPTRAGNPGRSPGKSIRGDLCEPGPRSAGGG